MHGKYVFRIVMTAINSKLIVNLKNVSYHLFKRYYVITVAVDALVGSSPGHQQP